MTKHPDLFAALAAPFDPNEVKVRSQNGRQLHYITARTVMNRLDGVLGPENWADDYEPFGAAGVKCRLTVILPDGSAITKTGVGGITEMHDGSDTDKTGESDALKRAAVKFGVGRYLYRDGVPTFVQERHPGTGNDPEPQAPEPSRDPRPAESRRPDAPRAGRREPGVDDDRGDAGRRQYDGPPRSGKALFAWTKDQEQRHAVGLLKYLNGWAKLQEFPGRMVDWDAEQVSRAYAEANRKLGQVQAAGSDAYEDALAN